MQHGEPIEEEIGRSRALGRRRRPARGIRHPPHTVAAAQAKHQAGAFDDALGLIGIAEAGPLDELQRAQVDLLRGQIAFALSRGRDVPPLLLKAAKRLAPLDIGLARDTYLEALAAALNAGQIGRAHV